MVPEDSGHNPFLYPNDQETLPGYGNFHALSSASQDDDDGFLSRIFSQHRLVTETSGEDLVVASDDANQPGMMGSGTKVRMTRKRTSGKTDRHSKIRTAQGLRDRRIRLSVQVSRKFFDLQDMLGFDKASSTIEWLIAKSKGAIKGLSLRGSSNSSKGVREASECEVSRLEESGPAATDPVIGMEKGKSCEESSRGNMKRDSRERARVRAKERTREKMMAKMSKFIIREENPNGCPNACVQYGDGTFGSVEIIEKFLGITSTSGYGFHVRATDDSTSSYHSENANYSGDDRLEDAFSGSGSAEHFGGGYYP